MNIRNDQQRRHHRRSAERILADGQPALHGIEIAAADDVRVVIRERGDLVVDIRHEMPDVPFVLPGSDGARIDDTLGPAEDEPVITKNFANAFHDTGLHELLTSRGIDQVVVVGGMSHMCIDATVRAANGLRHGTTTI